MLQHSVCHPQNPYPKFLLQPTLSNSFHSQIPLRTLKRSNLSCPAFRKGGGARKGYQRRRTMIRWKDIYKRVALLENPESGVSAVLNQCEIDGKVFEKSELCMFVKNLRKFRRYKLALEVCEWMNARDERFHLCSSDMAITLDLVAKVHGVGSAEDFFTRLPGIQKDKRVYGALLNAYVETKEKDRAELLMQKMVSEGCASYPLSFNVMMTLYLKLKEYHKVEMLISEMKRTDVRLDLYSYSIWLSARSSLGSVAGLEEVVTEMEEDPNVVPNCSTFSSVATFYIALGEIEKAKDYIERLKRRVGGRDREPYHSLLNLYGRVGEKEEVYRVWRIYKFNFQTITNWGYFAVIRSLVQVGDIEGAEKIYNEWLLVKSSYDARIGNILLSWYVKEGHFEKVESFFAHMEEAGAKPFATTWEILADYHTKERRISDALASFRRAKSSGYWKPIPNTVSSFIELCEKEGDKASKEEIVKLLRELGLSEYENRQIRSGDEDSEMLLPVI